MTRTLSYGRVSTQIQADEGYSLESQKLKAAEYARYRGWQPPIHFADEGISGRKDNRAGLSALLGSVRAGDMVLVKDITRLGRGGAVQTLTIIREIEERGGVVVLLDQNLDTSTTLGRMFLTLMAAVAELELEQIRERSMSGRIHAAKRGDWPSSSVPYGYRRSAARKLELDPDTAPHARRLMDALAGRSLREAAEYATAEQIGGREWQPTTLHHIRHNSAYIGTAIWEMAGVRVEVPCPPLVDETTWAAVQDHARIESGAAKPSVYPLSGHLRCIHGAPLTGYMPAHSRHRGKQPYRCYQIPYQAKQRYGCDCPQRSAARLEAEARLQLSRVLADPTDPLAIRALTDPLPAAPDTLAAERAEITAQFTRLTKLQLLGEIELSDYLALRTDLKAREKALAPPERVPSALPPAQLQLSRDVLLSTNEQLSRLLDVLRVRFLFKDKTLELVEYSPLA